MKKIISILTLVALVVTVIFSLPVTVSAKISLSRSSLKMIPYSNYTVSVKGTKAKATWSSTNSNIVTVSKKGKVTAKKSGTAYIKARVKNKYYSCKVNVKFPKPASKKVSKAFKKYMKNIHKTWYSGTTYKKSDFRFLYLNLNNGKTPALLVSNDSSFHAYGYYAVFVYSKGKVKKCPVYGSDNMSSVFFDSGTVALTRTNMGYSTLASYRISPKMSETPNARYCLNYNNADKAEKTYFLKDKKVSGKKYNKYIKSLKKNSVKISGVNLEKLMKVNNKNNLNKYL